MDTPQPLWTTWVIGHPCSEKSFPTTVVQVPVWTSSSWVLKNSTHTIVVHKHYMLDPAHFPFPLFHFHNKPRRLHFNLEVAYNEFHAPAFLLCLWHQKPHLSSLSLSNSRSSTKPAKHLVFFFFFLSFPALSSSVRKSSAKLIQKS